MNSGWISKWFHHGTKAIRELISAQDLVDNVELDIGFSRKSGDSEISKRNYGSCR